MIVITPLTLKSTKGMLEMQRLAPETKRLQQLYRNDRAKLNEEMMALYKEHKVNPMASCLPLLAQMPVFIIMFRVLHGLTYRPTADTTAPVARGVYAAIGMPNHTLGFLPRYISHDSSLFQSLNGQTQMISFGLDLAKRPAEALAENFATGLIYVLLVALLGILYFVQQRMVAARAAVSPQMSPSQQKLMQYLPVAFAIFQVFFLLGLVIYYMAQAILRIGQQLYITRKFYGHDEALGRQAQRASEQARELAKADGDSGGGGGGGFFAQARRELASPKNASGPTKAEKAATAAAATAGGGHRGGQRSVVEAHHPTQESPHPLGQGSGRTADPHPQRRPAGWAAWQRQEATLTAASPRATPTAERSNRMEWVETTGKSLDEAKDEALDRLGIVAEDAEFEVLEEPRTGLFGRTRGVARVRARVRPAAVRPKQDRRGRRRNDGRSEAAGSTPSERPEELATVDSAVEAAPPRGEASGRGTGQRRRGSSRPPAGNGDTQARPTDAGAHMNDDPIDAVTTGHRSMPNR